MHASDEGEKEISIRRVRTKRHRRAVHRLPRISFFEKFVCKNKKAINGISKIVEAMTTGGIINKTTGQRTFTREVDHEALEPFFKMIVEEAKKKINFPIKSATRNQEPVVVVAPAVSSRSNKWSKGKLHRDFSSVDESGVYTFELCLDEMTKKNGAIDFWSQTTKTEHDERHPDRGLEGMTAETIVVPKNTVLVWDSRLLHQSLPNETDSERKAIIWLVNSTRKPGVESNIVTDE